MNTEQLKTDKFRSWLKKNYGIQDFEDYKDTQTEELAIQFASQESKRAVDEFKEKLENELLNARLWVDAEVNKSYIEHVLRFIKKL